MKNILVAILLSCGAVSAPAQIHIGSGEAANASGSISKEDLAALKKTVTVFTVQVKDKAILDQFQAAIGSVWQLTGFRVITPDELDNYLGKPGYSFFTFGGFITQVAGGSTITTHTHLVYELWSPKLNKGKPAKGRDLFARFLLSPDEATLRQSNNPINTFGKRKQENDMMATMYTSAVFANWGPGYLKGYLNKIQGALATLDNQKFFREETDKTALSRLAGDTLYVPEYVNNRYSAFTGKETEADDEDNDRKNDQYSFTVRYVSSAILNRMILERQQPFYYLLYTRSSTDKYVTVFEGTKGSLLYTRYSSLSYNFKAKDMKKLSQAVK